MKNFGRMLGNTATGYYRGRNAEEDLQERYEDRDWKNDRREKQVDDEAYYDPIERETAGLGLQRGRREESYEDYADPYIRRGLSRQDRVGELATSEAEFSAPIRRRRLEREDTAGQMDMEDRQFRRPYDRRGIERQDTLDGMDVDDRRFQRPYDRRAAMRQDRAGVVEQDQMLRHNEVDAAGFDDFQRDQQYQQKYRSAQNALAHFRSTGNPIAIADYYDNMYDDDGKVTITKRPDGKYDLQQSDGQTAVYDKEQLSQIAENIFMSELQGQAPGGPMGGGYGGQSAGIGGRSGGGRSPYGQGGAGGGKQSAHSERVNMLAEDLLRSGEAGNWTEARMMAHAEASYKSQMRPEEAVRDFYTETLQSVMPSREEMQYKSPEERAQLLEEAKSMARELTDDYRQRYLSGYNREGSGMEYSGGDQGAGGGAEQAGQPAPAGQGATAQRGSYEEAVQILRANAKDPQMARFFDERYGPGAAEAALNGR